jgi:hypothetical protein
MTRFLALFVVLAALSGCSSRPGGAAADVTGMPATLDDLNALLHAATVPARPATKLADLDKYRGKFSLGYDAVKSGAVVVLWGTPVQDEGDAAKGENVMAYEKDVPANGGYVLMSAGTVKKMSAAEFQSAPKVGKP